jgi:hypothetical protein
MAEGHDSYSTGPDMPPEVLSQGSMNHNPNFRPSVEGEEPEVEETQFGVGPDGRSRIVKPGKYKVKQRAIKGLDGKMFTPKIDMTRTDH